MYMLHNNLLKEDTVYGWNVCEGSIQPKPSSKVHVFFITQLNLDDIFFKEIMGDLHSDL